MAQIAETKQPSLKDEGLEPSHVIIAPEAPCSDRNVGDSEERLERLLYEYGVCIPILTLSTIVFTYPGNMDLLKRPVGSLQFSSPHKIPHRHHLLIRPTYPHHVC